MHWYVFVACRLLRENDKHLSDVILGEKLVSDYPVCEMKTKVASSSNSVAMLNDVYLTLFNMLFCCVSRTLSCDNEKSVKLKNRGMGISMN